MKYHAKFQGLFRRQCTSPSRVMLGLRANHNRNYITGTYTNGEATGRGIQAGASPATCHGEITKLGQLTRTSGPHTGHTDQMLARGGGGSKTGTPPVRPCHCRGGSSPGGGAETAHSPLPAGRRHRCMHGRHEAGPAYLAAAARSG